MDSKVESIISQYEETLRKLSSPEIYIDHKKSKVLNKLLEELRPQYELSLQYNKLKKELIEAKEILNNTNNVSDKEFYSNIITHDSSLLLNIESSLAVILSESNNPKKSSILEIRAGTGGEESTLFAHELFKMYMSFCSSKGWQTQILSASHSSLGGIKEIIVSIEDLSSYPSLQYESGVHRVQRVPRTETSGRIHTSAVSVVVYPQTEEGEVKIDPSELEIFTYRSSGPGGQSVNTTDSAVRITHLPTGITVTCQDNKSQHKNKEHALKILKSRLFDIQLQKANLSISEVRKGSIKSGDRSDKIRTYNFPQDRITDHRINKSWYGIDAVLKGNIDHILTDLHTNIEISK